MDPITALSVAAAAGQFVSFAYDLAKGTAERYRSIEGTEKRLLAVAADAKHINELLDALSTPNDVTGGTGSFVKSRTTSTLTTKLDAIVQECHAVGVELQTLLDSTTVQPSEKRRMVQSVRGTFRSMRKDSEISRLHERLRFLREHVDSCLIMLLCTEASSTKKALSTISEGLTDKTLDSQQKSLNLMVNDIVSRINTTSMISSRTEELIRTMARDATDIRSRKTLMLAFYFPGIAKREDEVSEAHTKTFLWIFDGYSTDDHNEVISSATNTTSDKEKIDVEHVETGGEATNKQDTEKDKPSNSKSTAVGSAKVDKPNSNSEGELEEEEIMYPLYRFHTPRIALRGPSDTSNSEGGDEDPMLPAKTFLDSTSRDGQQIWYEDLPPVKNTGFLPWLRSGSGIYWITGKPGGGKSTLVKFIYSHAITAEALAEWKGTADYLVTACHHFWSAGFDLQKSEKGLLRSILYQIAASFPSILASVCPERDIDLRGDHGMSWTVGELWDILTRVIMCPETMQISVKFVLFIDGLDEYDGDQDEILHRLKSFAALPHTKICAASREWSVIYRHFMSDDVVPVLQIKVHEYTYKDIYRYTKDKLDGEHQPARFAPTAAERQALIKEVVDRAHGVFLWVNLVCKDLIRGYDNSDSFEVLLQRLRYLPTDLKPFFKKMVDDIDPIYKDDFGMLMSAMLNAVFFSCRRLNFADFSQGKQSWTLEDAWNIGPNLSTRQVKARGADLVEFKNESWDFIHRSVYDFLREDNQINEISLITKRNSFNPHLYWARQCLRGYFQKRPRYIGDSPTSIGIAIKHSLKYEAEAGTSNALFFDELDDLFSGKRIDYMNWRKGTTLAKAMENDLKLYTASVLQNQKHKLPEELFSKTKSNHKRFFTFVSSHDNHEKYILKATPLAMLIAVGCVSTYKHGYRIRSFHSWSPKRDMLELILPFGLPTMESVDFHPPIGAPNAWAFFLQFARHGVFYPFIHEPSQEVLFRSVARIIDEGDICDHFFDKRTHLPVERPDFYTIRERWLMVSYALQRRRRRIRILGCLPRPEITHWRYYLRGWASIIYLATLAPPTKHSDRDIEIAIAEWIFRARKINQYVGYPRAPKTLPRWCSYLPSQLDSFCKLLWPPVWLCIISIIYVWFVFVTPKPRQWYADISNAIVWMPSSSRYEGCGYATVVLTTHIIVWVASVFLCVRRRYMDYTTWFLAEQAAHDDLGREIRRWKRSPTYAMLKENHLEFAVKRRSRAKEADVIKIAAEARMRKLAIPYFISFLVFWLLFG